MSTPVTFWPESIGFPLLSIMTLVPMVASIALRYFSEPKLALRFAYSATLLNIGLSVVLLAFFENTNLGVQFAERISLFGFSYSVGVDGLNILFFPLITILTFLVLVYISATKTAECSKLLSYVLGYEAILIAAFCALNLMQFWLVTALELALVIAVTKHSGQNNAAPIQIGVHKTGMNQKQRHLVVILGQFFGASLFMTLCGFLLLAFGLVGSEHDLSFDLLTLIAKP